MLKDITRANVLQIWFAAIVLLVLAGAALGVNLTIGTEALLLILCVLPPGALLVLWSGVQAPTASDVLYAASDVPEVRARLAGGHRAADGRTVADGLCVCGTVASRTRNSSSVFHLRRRRGRRRGKR
jgi:hypothetical protein